jgi:hypothetical protein
MSKGERGVTTDRSAVNGAQQAAKESATGGVTKAVTRKGGPVSRNKRKRTLPTRTLNFCAV